MYKTELTYKTFTDKEITETLRFNLNEDELRDLIDDDPIFSPAFLSYVSREQDTMKMLKVIQKLIVMSYGEMSEDGKYFHKSNEKALDFLQSAAYMAFRDKLLSGDGEEFVNFMFNVFPEKFVESLKANAAGPNLAIAAN